MKKATGYQCKQTIIDAQAKDIKRLQEQIKDAEEVIANATKLINAQQERIAQLEAKLATKEQARITASHKDDKLVEPTRSTIPTMHYKPRKTIELDDKQKALYEQRLQEIANDPRQFGKEQSKLARQELMEIRTAKLFKLMK